jgi:hypothetical protein
MPTNMIVDTRICLLFVEAAIARSIRESFLIVVILGSHQSLGLWSGAMSLTA